MNPLEEREVICPYCGEMFGVLLDLTAGDQSYIEDCAICCQPIEFDMRIDDDTAVVEVRQADE